MFNSRKYRPDDPALVDDFLREQRHATLIAAAPGQAPQASILPFLLLDEDTVELHCVLADATFKAAAENPNVTLLVSDFLAFTPHDWIDPVDGSQSTLQFRALLLQGRATLSTDPEDVASALSRLLEAYGHGPQYRPIADDELYGPHLRRLGTIRIAIESRQAKFKVGKGSVEQRLDIARRLRQRREPGDERAADVIERLAPRLGGDAASDAASGEPGTGRGVLARPASERERLAHEIAERLHGPMTALGVIFLLVVLAQTLTPGGTALSLAFEVAAWALWAVFVVEFVARMVIAPSTAAFLRRNWWQVIFLAVPFLRFLRIVHAARAARAGRIVSSAIRSSRSARLSLTSRLAWLTAATVTVILAASQLLYEFSEFATYTNALHAAALTVVAGEPLPTDDGFSKVAEILLALYSVVVFATLAGTVGAYFFERRVEPRRAAS